MPPKTRKSVSLWQSCDTCASTINTKDLEKHWKQCPTSTEEWNHGFIKDKVLYSFLQPVNSSGIGLNINEEKKEDLVFISQSAMQLCEFMIGSHACVKISNNTYVRQVWPTSEGTLTTVQILKEGYNFSMGEITEQERVTVSNINVAPLPTKEIKFKVLQPLDVNLKTDTLSQTVRYRCRNKIVFLGTKIKVPFYGKNVIIEITHCERLEPSTVEENMEQLNLNETYFIPNNNTVWVLDEKKDKPEIKEIIDLNLVGGYEEIIKDLKENIMATLFPKINSGMQSCYGVLIYGAHGAGKTLIAQALANESKAHLVHIQGSELFSKFYGETENRLRALFQNSIDNEPSIILLDNVETVCPRKGSDQEKRVVATLFAAFDLIQRHRVVVLATTSRSDDIDSGLRRPGRLEREVEIPVPNPKERLEIFKKFSKDPNLEKSFEELAKVTHGFVGADLASVWTKACLKSAVGNQDSVTAENLAWAFTQVKPSAMRQLYVQVPNVLWSDIGGQEELKLKLKQAVEWPLEHPESFRRLSIKPPSGVLMFGPPGCSKTMIAKALATQTKLNFISVKGSDIFSKWVGESEKAVRDLFKKARSVAPSVVFLDEVDALGGERGEGEGGGGASVRERVLSQLLTEMDGVHSLESVLIIAATNRPDRIDKALLRPGRLDRLIYVPLPDLNTRKQILKIQLSKTPTINVSVDLIAEKTEGYSGAEVVAVCKEAALKALEEDIEAKSVQMNHFLSALDIVTPRTPKSLLKLYEDYTRR